jgi:hypothetical protein
MPNITERNRIANDNEYVARTDVRPARPALEGVTSAIATCMVALGVVALSSTPAHALPSFARQTGKPCAQCHTVAYGPALTAYGRQFKLNGYVWGDAKEVIPPFALMTQGGFTHTSKAQVDPPAPHFGLNDNLSVDQVSAFYGGRIASHVGAFVQVTYSGESRTTNWDNLDLRFANSATLGSTSIVYGISVNNNPTVQDLWNSTPAWSYPYISSGVGVGPAAGPMIAGGLAQLVLGATAYAMIDDHLYLEAGAYRGISDHWLKNLGVGSAANPHMDGPAPYWRATWQTDITPHYFSVGVFGMNTKLQPDASVPQTDRFNDLGADATYQFVSGDGAHAVTANLTAIHEKQSLDAGFAAGVSANNDNHLNTKSLDVTYAYQQTWVASAGLFDTSGSTDMGLYAPAPVSGSLNGSPNSRGYIVQLEYVPFGKLDSFAAPWLNLRVGLQYTAYQRFNGAGANYDGFGRSASDNNTLFGFFWFAL